MKNSYRPISCDFHSELELLALRQTLCPVVFFDENGTETDLFTTISDIITRNSEEFLLLPNGTEVRLDRLISVNGLELSKYSC